MLHRHDEVRSQKVDLAEYMRWSSSSEKKPYSKQNFKSRPGVSFRGPWFCLERVRRQESASSRRSKLIA
jgi:hypothetical protein